MMRLARIACFALSDTGDGRDGIGSALTQPTGLSEQKDLQDLIAEGVSTGTSIGNLARGSTGAQTRPGGQGGTALGPLAMSDLSSPLANLREGNPQTPKFPV
jgi:hypothetical protein